MSTRKQPPTDYDSMGRNEAAPLLGMEKAFYGGQRKMSTIICWATTLLVLCILMLIATVVLGVIVVVRVTEEPASAQSESVELPPWPDPSNSPLGVYYKAAVAAENGICSEIGRDTMVHGGNAVDGAIATTFCMGVMNPQHSGMGGGHFMVIYNRTTRQCYSIDARETAPGKAGQNMYENNTSQSIRGWQSIAVPGELHGLWVAYIRFGSVPWRYLVQPIIDLLDNGIPVSSALAEVLERSRHSVLAEPTLMIFINNATQDVYKAGEVMQRPVLAKTMRIIANSADPVSLFYSGSIAQKLSAEFQSNGALITANDLSRYKSKWRDPAVTRMANGLSACGTPPPSSAAITHLILNVLSGFPFNPRNSSTLSGNVEMYHKFIEAMKFAYAQRSQLGDTDFVPNALSIVEKLLSKKFADKVRTKITEKSHPSAYYSEETSEIKDHGTTTISVLDGQGNAVTVTSSINLEFGSQRRSESTGIIWNDSMDDFSASTKPNSFGIAPSGSNFIQPFKRPMSSMSPSVFFNENTGNVRLAIGAAGGSKIISGIAYAAMRVLFLNETVKEAIDKPRLHNQFSPDITEFEAGFPRIYIDKLKERGQRLIYGYSSISAVTAVERKPNGQIFANSDRRKGPSSYPAGY